MAKFPNVEARAKSIRIKFEYKGGWCRETIPLAPSRENLKLAYDRLSSVNKSIARNEFNYRLEFPKSKNPDKLGLPELEINGTRLFGEVAHDYIATIQHLTPETILSYKKILNHLR